MLVTVTEALRKISVMISLESTKSADTFGFNDETIQLIKMMVGEPEEVIEQFDFNINMNVWKLNKNYPTIILGKEIILAKKDNPFNIMNPKTIELGNNVKTPISLLHRTQKMLDKGYSLSKSNFVKMLDLVKNEVKNHKDELISSKSLTGLYGYSKMSSTFISHDIPFQKE